MQFFMFLQKMFNCQLLTRNVKFCKKDFLKKLLLGLFLLKLVLLYLLDLDLGSRGPSTVTLMALLYVATC